MRRAVRLGALAVATGSAAAFLVASAASHKKLSHLVPGDGEADVYLPPSRHETLRALEAKRFDVLVLGGGATGCGVTLDALSRGLSVAMVEKDDFGSGTSGRSTKLIHGGVRYLALAWQNKDLSQLKLVYEALKERGIMLRQAPHLTRSLGILMPTYSYSEVPMVFLGLKMYDWLARRGLHPSYFITPHRALQQFPQLRAQGLTGAIVYYDGQFNDARFNVAAALTSAREGGVVVNHAKAVAIHHNEEGRVCGASVQDTETGKMFKVQARVVVNATGHLSDEIRKMDNIHAKNVLVAAAGTHIVIGADFAPRQIGLLIPRTEDGRVVFLLPWEGRTLAGTTDSPCEPCDNPRPTQADVDYIIRHVNTYFERQISHRDILSAWSGIRPLKKSDERTDTASISREHGIFISDRGLITIVGGKWTTYRKMGWDIVNHAISTGKIQPTSPSSTSDLKLVGATNFHPLFSQVLVDRYGLDTSVAEHISRSYGDQAIHVAERVRSDPILGQRIVADFPYIAAEVLHAVENEMARTALDILSRRTRLTFLDSKAALDAAPKVVQLMAPKLAWDARRCAREVQSVVEFVGGMH